MKAQLFGMVLAASTVAFSVNTFAFSTATVKAGASASITATDQLLYVYAPGTTDNPAGMGTVATNGKLTVDFGSNGTASKGLQGDATYTYDNVIRVKNNNSGAKNISLALSAAAPAGLTVEFSVAPYASGACGTTAYSASPAAVSAAAAGEVCVGVKLVTASTITAGAKTLDFAVSAS